MKSIEEVLEQVGVLIDTHLFNEFAKTKSSMFLKKVISNQKSIEMNLFKKHGDHEPLPINHESDKGDPGEPPACGEKEGDDHKEECRVKMCWCSKSWQALNAKQIISCCK